MIWAIPDWPTWAVVEQAWLAAADGTVRWPGGAPTTLELGADWRRSLLVDSPLSPLRIGRQPEVTDRIPSPSSDWHAAGRRRPAVASRRGRPRELDR